VAAVYPQAAEWVDDVAAARLLGAYVRRKRYEARLAVAAFAESLTSAQGSGQERVSAVEMLGMFGVTI
jgi:hypothetical protein